MSITVGLKGRAEDMVVETNTAAAMGSGLVPVYATPSMIALMENASAGAVAPHLAEGEGTVGTHLDVYHDSATPLGLKVWAESELTAVEGKQLTFTVHAYDERGLIGKGTHQRFIISVDRFLAKTERKKEAT